ncbi:MAG: hypothetical protein BAJATHORv1_30180 [Candidatus Thorarchaeota archaeon]|nr:MAG: hypothetical protein BAJATHORv1_30180 [Candidatus Thorarchaeota archaeon]
MRFDAKSCLILSPHTDDIELSAGATIRKFIENGCRVKSLVFSDCKKSVDTSRYEQDVLVKECRAAAKHLGINELEILEYPVREFPKYRQEILEKIYSIRKEMKPELVIAPWEKDLHQDHQTVAKEALRAFMRTDTSIWAYQVPGTCSGFTPDIFISITESEIEQKIELLYKYESQVVRRDYFQPNKIRGMLSYFGTFIGLPYAEGFMNCKSVLNLDI